MNTDTNGEQAALKIIDSSMVSCEKMRDKVRPGSPQASLLKNRLAALALSKAVLTKQPPVWTQDEVRRAMGQIASIRRKSAAGLRRAKEGTGTHTRFRRLVEAMDVILAHLQDALAAAEETEQ